jgi:hypothetical protein
MALLFLLLKMESAKVLQFLFFSRISINKKAQFSTKRTQKMLFRKKKRLDCLILVLKPDLE